PNNGGERKREALLKYLDAASPSGSLCLEVASWNESTRLAKRVAVVGIVVQCETDRPQQIPSWLERQAREQHGKRLSRGAAQLLQEYLGNDFASLTHALGMLALYVKDGGDIDTAEVDALIARGHHERVWDLCDAVAERRVARALGLLDAFWTEGMLAPQIVGLLRSTFRQLVRVRSLGGRMGLDAAMARANVPRPAFTRVRRAVEAFSEDDLADAYQALVDADLEAKTGSNDRMVMEALVHQLCRPAAARVVGSAGAGPSA
ncbi:MAG: DNA polymerase III subunit delta, partial [Planctomycetes bacterium]|nr:DNA polymerase III subunit delta [Planctomycetota bacterium]